MKRLIRSQMRVMQITAVILIAFITYAGVRSLFGAPPVHSLPEYSPRTGETCAVCHVSAGGGGPRTLRGLLWAARGRPDQVPTLPGMLIAPAEIVDGLELYDIACAGCHGYSRSGLFAIGLANSGISQGAIRSFTLNGIPELNMPAFDGQFTDEQLEALVAFVADLGDGQIPPEEYPLPPSQFICAPVEPASCGGK
ncbi:MAG: cytochrome c [Anaerolineales bacterium]|nr:cytochrome c [Anaerolineales bacterium]